MTRGRVPLDRALSKLGLASRADARRLIREGRVAVDGTVAQSPLRLVVPEQVSIAIDGIARTPRAAHRTIAFHKPRGVVTTTRDPDGRRTVFDVLGSAGDGLVAVGRLDRASTGLLILTTDTQLANRLTDPANHIVRRYVVTVRGRVDADAVTRLVEGIDTIDTRGRHERLSATHVSIRKASGRETHLIIELDEGRNREIRRMLAALGHEVTRLHRIAFGAIELGNLQPGEWRPIA